jgi:hypothetical protein
MSDMYRELLVKREPKISDRLFQIGLILLTALAAAAVVFVTPWASLALIALCIFDYFKFPSFHLEYEYLYVNGELDVDKIMSQKSRKKAASYNIADNMELLAPWDSHDMDYYRKGYQGKVTDFSSGRPDAKVYAMVYAGEKGTEIMLFEPDEIMLKDMQRIAPRKVHV